MIDIRAEVNQRDIDRVTKRLDKWQGSALAKRVDKALAAGARLFAIGLKARAPKRSGGLSRSVKVTRVRSRDAIATYRVMPTKRVPDKGRTDLLTAILVHGSDRGVESNPFVDETQRALQPSVTAFIGEQIRRLE